LTARSKQCQRKRQRAGALQKMPQQLRTKELGFRRTWCWKNCGNERMRLARR